MVHIPRLRRYARALVSNGERADDQAISTIGTTSRSACVCVRMKRSKSFLVRSGPWSRMCRSIHVPIFPGVIAAGQKWNAVREPAPFVVLTPPAQ